MKSLMKNLLTIAVAVLALTRCGCSKPKSSSSDEPVSNNKYVNYLQKDLDDENANQFIIDLGKASQRFLSLAKDDAEEAKAHINELRDFLKDNEKAIDELDKENDKVSDIVEKFLQIDPESAEALNKLKNKNE